MSRASISTGEILFNTNAAKTGAEQRKTGRDDSKPLHIAIIGDFSGRGSRGDASKNLAQRRVIEIDRDNFDEVFSDLNVAIQLPFNSDLIRFSEFDDLHPDFLYGYIDLFSQFRSLKRRLKNPATFAEAVAEIRTWSDKKSENMAEFHTQRAARDEAAQSGIPLPQNMLDALLVQSQQNAQNALFPGGIDALVKDIIAPYVEAKADPRLPEMEAAVDEATSHSLRTIMHSGAFQELEANWRALYLLVKRIDTSSQLKLSIIDISREELMDDLLNNQDLRATQLYTLLVEKYRIPGAQAFSLLQFNFYIGDTAEDLRLASAIANIAAETHAVALAGAKEQLAGCASFDRAEDSADWQYPVDEQLRAGWQQFRQQAAAESLALVAPRFIVRLPFGKRTSPIESFAFEELGANNAHEFFCWANSAHLLTLLIAHAWKKYGWKFAPASVQEITDLPIYVYQEEGESLTKAIAECYLTDSGADKLAEAGILSVRSVKNANKVMIPRWRSVAANGRDIFSLL